MAMAAGRRLVLFPGLGMGHLIPMLELAAVCIRHGLAVTIAVPDPAFTAPGFSSTLRKYAARLPSLSVHSLPPPVHHVSPDAAAHPLVRMLAVLRAQVPGLRDFLLGLHPVQALVADMFSVDALDVAAEVGIAGYLFFCTAATNLAVFLRLPHVCSWSGGNLRELGDAPVKFPGLRPLPASHLLEEVLDRGTDVSAAVLDVFERMASARGIVVNTFEALEGTGVASLRNGRCLPNRATPPVYCIGPLIADGAAEEERRHPCLSWLDAQPERSIVFLCFGSRGALSPEQVREMATGLERSRQRFLWVLRAPAPAPTEPDAALALLPEGFLARTADMGVVVTASWVPQVAVLKHASTGAFLTHCGWNSTLEAIAAGVPMVCWPLDAEQWMNKVFIVEEMKVGVEVRGHRPGALVAADIVDATLRRVMDSEGRQGVVERVMAAKENAAAAWKEGGSSCAAFAEFLKNMEMELSEQNVGEAYSSQIQP